MTIGLLLLILALVCFVLATFGVNVRSINLTATGLACLTLYLLLGAGAFD